MKCPESTGRTNTLKLCSRLLVLTVLCVTSSGLHTFNANAATEYWASGSLHKVVNEQESPFSEQQILSAVQSGVLVALAAFAFLAVYNAIRSAHRGDLQAWWHEVYSGLIKPLLRTRNKH